jgi:hypothetical protein
VAEFQDHMETVEDMLRAADEDLYRNKTRRPHVHGVGGVAGSGSPS